LNTQVDVQSEVLTEYVSTSVTEAAEVGSIHISSASIVICILHVGYMLHSSSIAFHHPAEDTTTILTVRSDQQECGCPESLCVLAQEL
jgi:hypothetical protein